MSMEFTAVSLLLLVEGLPAGRRSLVPCVSNLDDQRCHFGLSGTGGMQTLCWRKQDSNPRSPVANGQIQMRHKTLAERDGVIEPSARRAPRTSKSL